MLAARKFWKAATSAICTPHCRQTPVPNFNVEDLIARCQIGHQLLVKTKIQACIRWPLKDHVDAGLMELEAATRSRALVLFFLSFTMITRAMHRQPQHFTESLRRKVYRERLSETLARLNRDEKACGWDTAACLSRLSLQRRLTATERPLQATGSLGIILCNAAGTARRPCFWWRGARTTKRVCCRGWPQ